MKSHHIVQIRLIWVVVTLLTTLFVLSSVGQWLLYKRSLEKMHQRYDAVVEIETEKIRFIRYYFDRVRAAADTNKVSIDDTYQILGSIYDFSKKYTVPPDLLLSLFEKESNFNKKARSPTGAIGIGQMLMSTARLVSLGLSRPVYDLYDIRDNIEFCTFWLSLLIRDGQLHAVAEYKEGPKWVLGIPYAKSVLANKAKWQ